MAFRAWSLPRVAQNKTSESEPDVKAKQKRIVERLEQIKERAAELAVQGGSGEAAEAVGLAEEAAGLGLELAEDL